MSNKKKEEQKRFDQLYPLILYNDRIMHIGRLLLHAAQRLNNHPALICDGVEISYAQLYGRAVLLSKLLLSKGVKPHDRILLLIENSPEFYVGYFGIVQVGAVVAPLNVFLKERELAHIIDDAQPVLIIASSDFLPLLESAKVSLPPVLTEKDMPLYDVSLDIPSFECIGLEPEAMAALLYTSGTTGLPKGVMLSSENIMTNVLQGITRFDLRSDDRICAVLPLFHSFAQNTCVWTPMFTGSTVIIVRKIERRPIMLALEQKPTVFLGVPALYGLLCLLKTAPLQNIRCFVSGGDAMPDKIRSAFELIYRRKICSGYGLTEASPFVAGDLQEETVPTNTVGQPLVMIDALIKDSNNGAVLPQGEIGLLWLKGPNVMLGYYNEQEATKAVLVDGWLNTGDLAYRDSKGRIVITGRLKDIIKHKGFIIYPPEIENIILTYPNALRAAVIGKLDEATGEIPVAYVQIKNPESGVEKALRDLCFKNLATYKVPRDFICTTQELPMTATGKIDKKKLRK